jgi:hypothetical protein
VKRLLHRQREVTDILDQEVVLHDRSRDAHGVAFLERIEPDRRCRHLSGDDHHRDRIHVGGGDSRHGVCDSRTRRHQRNADVAGGAGVAVGGMHGGLLVPHQHVLNGFLLVQRVVDVQHGAAGVAPDVLDTFGL